MLSLIQSFGGKGTHILTFFPLARWIDNLEYNIVQIKSKKYINICSIMQKLKGTMVNKYRFSIKIFCIGIHGWQMEKHQVSQFPKEGTENHQILIRY